MRRSRGRSPDHSPPRALVWMGVLACAVFVGAIAALLLRRSFPPSLAPSAAPASLALSNIPGFEAAAATNTATAPTNEAQWAAMFETLPDDEKVAALLERGTQNLSKGDYAAGLQLYRAALKIKPEDEDIHFNIGVALARMGQIDQAIASYQESLRLFPDYAEAHNNLGNLLANRGQVTEAMMHLNAALKAAPDNASAHNNFGSVLARQGDLQKAMEHFELANRLQTNYVEAQFNLASTYLELGRVGLAIDKYSEILREQPDFKPAQVGLQRARRRQAEGK